MKLACILGVAAVLTGTTARPLVGEQKRTITAADCLTVRALQHDDSTFRSTIKISPDGTRIAYVVTAPNLVTDQNDVELYVRRLPTDSVDAAKPILTGDISAVRWDFQGNSLTVLMKEDGRRVLEIVDPVSGEHRVLFKADADINEYSIDKSGKTVAYAIDEPLDERGEHKGGPSTEEIARGYLIPFQRSTNVLWMKERLFVTHWEGGKWSTPEAVTIESPLNNRNLTALPYGNGPDLNPALSPDGKYLLVSYFDFSPDMPAEWRNSGAMQLRNSVGIAQAFHLLVLYDLISGETRVALKTPWVVYAPLWSADGKSFVVVAQPPVGSELERENVKNHIAIHSAGEHLFWVDPSTGKVEDVAHSLAYPWEGPLFWKQDGDILVRVGELNSISRFTHDNGAWRLASTFRVPLQLGVQVATNGDYVVGEHKETLVPPQLFVYRPGEKQVQVFAKLNPQFDEMTLAQPQVVHWKTSTGYHASGLLLLPPGYDKTVKYPLVIQTKPFTSSFVCSFGTYPSFAPQPMANAGIIYLGQISTAGSTQRQEDYFPKGYPGTPGFGGIAEAAFEMDLWDSAVQALSKQGLIDSNRVGIIGFSRTGWYTEFILAHSPIHYRAATVSDNVQYTLGEYWLSHDSDTLKSYDLVYGGPPYGRTLKNWLDNSVSFNLDKFHTPVLMEQMGHHITYDNPVAPPVSIAVSFEVFTGLNRLNKPVELYYYTNEEHTVEHPKARLASMQRNVDWYRFWLQGYERPEPEDPQQYVRWHKLRDLQLQDTKSLAPETAPAGGPPAQNQP